MQFFVNTNKSFTICFQIIADSLVARQMLNDVTARHNELMEMESNIRDIHEIFQELANMVEQQVCLFILSEQFHFLTFMFSLGACCG